MPHRVVSRGLPALNLSLYRPACMSFPCCRQIVAFHNTPAWTICLDQQNSSQKDDVSVPETEYRSLGLTMKVCAQQLGGNGFNPKSKQKIGANNCILVIISIGLHHSMVS